jgi:transposase
MKAKLSERKWSKILSFLRSQSDVYVGKEDECHHYIEGVLWILRSGAQWRFLPNKYGNWNSVYKRFSRWCDKGIWERMMQYFAEDPDMENLLVDSTIVRAHPCAAGAPKKNGGQESQALGRSRGGFSTKIHISTDALGNPLRFTLTAGQRHDITQAYSLIEGFEFDRVIADKGYAAQDFIDKIVKADAEAIIPSHRRALIEREYDVWLYRERHLIECFINKIKHYRRIFSRFEKLSSRYLGFLQLVGALIWLL